MDRFRTRVDIPEPAVKISYRTKSVFMGSCFADDIGKIMADRKFPTVLNPFGTLFNPLSISDNIVRLISGNEFTPEELHYHDGLWFSFSHYTGFSHPRRETCLDHINRSFLTASQWLKTADLLLLTFGTAFTYRLTETGKTVANCHKLPASSFTRTLAEPAEIIRRCDALLHDLKQFNPALRVIFTLSPVRHWSDGAVGNQLSKSILHYSIHEIISRNSSASYFPAYEIFMDELRDYRFYAADMLHPSEQGIHYVWERFSDAWLDDPSKKIMAGVTAVLKAAGHRPLHTESTNHNKFVQNTRKQIERLTGLYPFLDFSNEIALLQLDDE
jgi:hypothetical protein